MLHPLFTLLSQQVENAPELPQTATATSLADDARVAGGSGGEAGGAGAGGVGGVGGGGSGVASDPWQVATGVSVLAILDPPAMDGSHGRVQFAPGLTLDERMEIMFDIEWFDVRVRRKRQSESLSNSTWFANW